MCVDPVPFQSLSLDAVRRLAARPSGTCISLYAPTPRRVLLGRPAREGYRQLVARLERTLDGDGWDGDARRLLEPLRALGDDAGFWEQADGGIAVLAADGRADGFRLPAGIEPRATVANRFHLRPLVHLASAARRFRLLTLTSREARIYEGTSVNGSVTTIAPARFPREAGPLAGIGIVFQSDVGVPASCFLGFVDRVIAGDREARGTPLILAADPSVAEPFRALTHAADLLPHRIDRDLHHDAPANIARACTEVMKTVQADEVAFHVAQFTAARDRGKTSVLPADIGRAAVTARVATLLVEKNRRVEGTFDRETGCIEAVDTTAATPASSSSMPRRPADDILGAIAETVVSHAGHVVELDRAAMPTTTGMAAVHRA